MLDKVILSNIAKLSLDDVRLLSVLCSAYRLRLMEQRDLLLKDYLYDPISQHSQNLDEEINKVLRIELVLSRL